MRLWGGRFGDGPDARMADFTRSIEVDAELALDDIAGSIAHVVKDGHEWGGSLMYYPGTLTQLWEEVISRMTPPPAVEVLSRAPGFMGREPAALATIASRLEMVVAAKGENITEAGRRAEDAFMVAEGRVAVLTNVGGGRVERVAVLGPGQMFGHLALADDQGRSATCRALDPTYLLRIPGALYRTYEREDSEEARVFRRALIDALSIQLRLANEHLVTLTKRGA